MHSQEPHADGRQALRRENRSALSRLTPIEYETMLQTATAA